MNKSAIGIIFRKNEVLLVKRQDVPVWVLPGGGIDSGETSQQAVVREVLEETGYQVSVKRQIAEYYPINRLSALTMTYECCIENGKPTLTSETSDIGFFPLSNLPKMLFPLHKDWIQDAFNKQETTLRKPISQISYFYLIKTLLRHPIISLKFFWTRLKDKRT